MSLETIRCAECGMVPTVCFACGTPLKAARKGSWQGKVYGGLGLSIRAVREEIKMSLPSLAKLIDCDEATLADIENEKFDPPFILLLRIAEKLGVTLNDILRLADTLKK